MWLVSLGKIRRLQSPTRPSSFLFLGRILIRETRSLPPPQGQALPQRRGAWHTGDGCTFSQDTASPVKALSFILVSCKRYFHHIFRFANFSTDSEPRRVRGVFFHLDPLRNLNYLYAKVWSHLCWQSNYDTNNSSQRILSLSQFLILEFNLMPSSSLCCMENYILVYKYMYVWHTYTSVSAHTLIHRYYTMYI